MSKVIIQYEDYLKVDDIDRLQNAMKKRLDEDGFIIVDGRAKIYVIDEEENGREN